MERSKIGKMILDVFREFFQEKSFLHGAALAYYALLALVPLLYLSVTFFGNFVGHAMMLELIADVLQEQIGLTDVSGILDFLDNVDLGHGNSFLQIMGLIALMFSCTAILNSLKRSLNEFYDLERLKMSRKRKIVRGFLSRLMSMAFVVGITTLIVVFYFAETIFISMGNELFEDSEFFNSAFSGIVKHGVPVVSNWIIFAFVFKYLHDGKVNTRMVIHGGLITSVLLFLGQLLIKYYLMHYFFAANGGVAGALLIVLVWVYYSSQIIFLGAKFIAVYSRYNNVPIKLRD